MNSARKTVVALGSLFFPAPDRVRAFDVVLSVILVSALLLFAPDEIVRATNIGRTAHLAVFCASFVAGIWSAYLFRKKDASKDPFYLRSWPIFISGTVALPLCLLFRSSAWHLALVFCLFGLGAITGNVFYRIFGRF